MGTYSKPRKNPPAEPDHTDPRQVERDLNEDFVTPRNSRGKSKQKEN